MPPKKAASKKVKPRTSDRHKDTYMVRVTGAGRTRLAELAAKNRRPMSTELDIAVEERYKREISENS